MNIYIYIYIYIIVWPSARRQAAPGTRGPQGCAGTHSSDTSCLTQVFFKSGQSYSNLWWSLTRQSERCVRLFCSRVPRERRVGVSAGGHMYIHPYIHTCMPVHTHIHNVQTPSIL